MAIETQGTHLQVKISGVWTDVAKVVGFSGLGSGEPPEITTTHLLSTAREYKVGLADEGNVTVNFYYLPADATHDYLKTARNNRTEEKFRVIYSDASEEYFRAFVRTFARAVEPDNVVQGSMSLRLTGPITDTEV